MAEDMAVKIVVSFAGKIGDRLWASTQRQFGYLVHYNGHLESFRGEIAKLQNKLSSLKEDIDSATRNGQLIRPEVKDWMAKARGFEEEALKFLEDDLSLNTRCFNGWFPNLVTRYNIGKAAKKRETEATKLLNETLKFASISSLPPPPGMDSMSSANFVVYETTKVAISKVIQALENENIDFVGIHGMGGVGKTTLVKEVGKQAKEKKLFDEVVMAVVSQNIDVRKIQGQLADMLGLHFGEESETGRAGRLLARIKDVEKMLVILDDAWAKFDVKAVGIPFGNDHKGCKIVVTTRRLEVCRSMCVTGPSTKTKIVSVGCLTEEESWDLFGRNAGEVVENPICSEVAREIAKECKGLPVAIVTVGGAMRGVDDPEEWKEALGDLRRSVPRNIEGVEENVFKCIKFSYDYLKNKEAERCFMLCSLFPEDDDICIELLVRYAVGLEVIEEEVDTVEDVRHRVKLLIKKLINACLLIACEYEGNIKMHDVVRDVALSIGSEEYFVRAGVGLKEWPSKGMLDHHTHSGVSLMNNQITQLPCNFSGKKTLKILLLQGNNGCLWNNSFFEGMNKLRVVDISWFGRIPTMVGSGGFHLTCLQTLVLEHTEFESSTSAIGEIETLVVLSLKFCRFKESPSFIRSLTNLKLLDMSWCRGEIVIQRNSIAGLTRLEELYLYDTITRWEFGKELHSLSRLKVLKFFVDENVYLPEDFVFPCNLESFSIADYTLNNIFGLLRSKIRHDVDLNLNLLLPNLKTVEVYKCSRLKQLFPPFMAPSLQKLESLTIGYSTKIREVVTNENGHALDHRIVFESLRSITLLHLPNLNGFCMGSFPFEFLSLEQVRIEDCPTMKTFTAAVDIHIPKLKSIKLDGEEIMLQGVDLNTVLQNHFKAKEMENASQTSN